jgi:hypothetical protein
MNKFFLTTKIKVYKNFTLYNCLFLFFIFSSILFSEIYEKTIDFTSKYNVNKSFFSPLIINFPNPFSSETYIYIRLPQKNDCLVKIYDLFGNLVKKFELIGQQEYIVIWDGTDEKSNKVASGGYIGVLEYSNIRVIRKIGYIK